MRKNIYTRFAGMALFLFLVGFGMNFLSAETGIYSTDSATSGKTSTETTTTNTTTSSEISYTDTTPPIIKLNGESVVYLKVGASYSESGAAASDNVDGNISERIVRESNVNTAVAGTYRVVYSVHDRAGNKAEVLRTVYVEAPSPASTIPNEESSGTVSGEPATRESTTNTSTAASVTPTESESFEVQIEHLLEILREGNVQRVEEEKTRIIQSATSSSSTSLSPGTVSTKATSDDSVETHENTEESAEPVEEKIQKVLERAQNISVDETRADSDSDGISNYDEQYIYETDSESTDTDGDGYSDRAEISTGFDPKNPSLQGIITYENPKDNGEVKKDLLTVAAIAVVETAIGGEKDIVRKVEFKGRGLPNSFVTIYIFSVPTVITVKTDNEGNWKYVMDKELADGEHEMYVAMTDNAGKILAKGAAIPFVKEANAITVDQNLLTPISSGRSPSLLWGEYMYAAITVVLSAIGIIFAIIGIRSQRSYSRARVTPEKENTDSNINA